MNYKTLKRAIDLVFSLVAFLILSPVFITVIIIQKFYNRSNSIFFIQNRPGLNGKLFRVIKFKTMNDEKNENGQYLPDSIRLTKIGRFLRKTSLDEIPQLINVIKGEMSFVGPRPLLVEYLDLYNDYQKRRHEVKPGITGWAQVNGRNAISWHKKFELDVWYVDNISFWLDIRILFFTLKKVIISEGISSETSVTMEKFKGNN